MSYYLQCVHRTFSLTTLLAIQNLNVPLFCVVKCERGNAILLFPSERALTLLIFIKGIIQCITCHLLLVNGVVDVWCLLRLLFMKKNVTDRRQVCSMHK